jgi:hypothetical protein
MWNGHRPHGHQPWRQHLVSAAPNKRHHPPHHQKRNVIHVTHEGSRSTTTLAMRLWQRMWTPIPRHPGHPQRRQLFLHQTDKHPRGQKDHVQQNSMRLQTTQERKGMCPTDRGRRQPRLLRQRFSFHGRHHNIQNPIQQHTLHRGHRHDDGGH